jgi:hypothetical protein
VYTTVRAPPARNTPHGGKRGGLKVNTAARRAPAGSTTAINITEQAHRRETTLQITKDVIKERRYLLRGGRPHPLTCQTRPVFVPFAGNRPHGRFEVARVLPVHIQPRINVRFGVLYARFTCNRPGILDIAWWEASISSVQREAPLGEGGSEQLTPEGHQRCVKRRRSTMHK